MHFHTHSLNLDDGRIIHSFHIMHLEMPHLNLIKMALEGHPLPKDDISLIRTMISRIEEMMASASKAEQKVTSLRMIEKEKEVDIENVEDQN